MKKGLFIFILSLPLLSSAQVSESGILGVWLNEKKEAVVEIYQDNGRYFGKIIDIRGRHAHHKEALRDINNPHPEFRDRPLLQMPLLENLRYEDGEFVDGTAYNPRLGRYFKCKAWLVSEKKMRLRGYLGFFFATEEWEKIEWR